MSWIFQSAKYGIFDGGVIELSNVGKDGTAFRYIDDSDIQAELPKFYFGIHFLNDENLTTWPSIFAIFTAYTTIAGKWTNDEQKKEADDALRNYLNMNFSWVKRFTSFSSRTKPSHTGWAVNVGWKQARDIGLILKQDAIYFIAGNTVAVSYCDNRKKLIAVGDFISRLRGKSFSTQSPPPNTLI